MPRIAGTTVKAPQKPKATEAPKPKTTKAKSGGERTTNWTPPKTNGGERTVSPTKPGKPPKVTTPTPKPTKPPKSTTSTFTAGERPTGKPSKPVTPPPVTGERSRGKTAGSESGGGSRTSVNWDNLGTRGSTRGGE